MMPKSSPSSNAVAPQISVPQADSKRRHATGNTARGAKKRKPSGQDSRSLPTRVSMVELLDSEYRGISLYAVAMLLLVLAILWTGINVVEQIQTYHQKYGELSKLKREFRQLQIERQRMLIEQQTFSSTPQVTNRAMTELNMFYPDFQNRMIIDANGVVALPRGQAANQPHTAQAAIQAPAQNTTATQSASTVPVAPQPNTVSTANADATQERVIQVDAATQH